MGGDTIRMTDEAVRKVVTRFNRIADDLEGARTDIRSAASSSKSGTGEFSGQMSSYSDSFKLSWLECLGLGSESARIIAGNTNQKKIDLDRIDGDHGDAANGG